MKTELLHKYFRGETNGKRGKPNCGMDGKQCREQGTLFERTNVVWYYPFFRWFEDTAEAERTSVSVSADCHCRHVGYCFCRWLPHMHKPKQQLSQTIRIPAGQRAQMDLPDGSVVWLNSQTTLTYDEDFGKKDRKVTLDGEAYSRWHTIRKFLFMCRQKT